VSVTKLVTPSPIVRIFAICDSDPDGIHILCTYAFGSITTPTLSSWMGAEPSIRWLGTHISDLHLHNIGNVLDGCTLPMSARDSNHCREMLTNECLDAKPLWKRELENMLCHSKKVETEAVATQHPHFFVQEYIPHKIRFGHWY